MKDTTIRKVFGVGQRRIQAASGSGAFIPASGGGSQGTGYMRDVLQEHAMSLEEKANWPTEVVTHDSYIIINDWFGRDYAETHPSLVRELIGVATRYLNTNPRLTWEELRIRVIEYTKELGDIVEGQDAPYKDATRIDVSPVYNRAVTGDSGDITIEVYFAVRSMPEVLEVRDKYKGGPQWRIFFDNLYSDVVKPTTLMLSDRISGGEAITWGEVAQIAREAALDYLAGKGTDLGLAPFSEQVTKPVK